MANSNNCEAYDKFVIKYTWLIEKYTEKKLETSHSDESFVGIIVKIDNEILQFKLLLKTLKDEDFIRYFLKTFSVNTEQNSNNISLDVIVSDKIIDLFDEKNFAFKKETNNDLLWFLDEIKKCEDNEKYNQILSLVKLKIIDDTREYANLIANNFIKIYKVYYLLTKILLDDKHLCLILNMISKLDDMIDIFEESREFIGIHDNFLLVNKIINDFYAIRENGFALIEKYMSE